MNAHPNRDPSGRGEGTAQPRDLNREGVLAHLGGVVDAQFVKELVSSNDPVGVAQKQGQESASARAADRHRLAAEPNLQRSQDLEVKAGAHKAPAVKSPAITRRFASSSLACAGLETRLKRR